MRGRRQAKKWGEKTVELPVEHECSDKAFSWWNAPDCDSPIMKVLQNYETGGIGSRCQD